MAELFLDCDGVLADFDSGAREVLGGLSPREFEARHSKGEFWRRLANARNFYATLPLMADAQLLFDATQAYYDVALSDRLVRIAEATWRYRSIRLICRATPR